LKKLPKHYSQTFYLFVVYGSFILLLLTIFFTFAYSSYKENTLENAENSIENLCASVQDSVAAQMDNLSTISMNIVYSNAIKANFKDFSRLYQDTGMDPETTVASREKAEAIHEIVTAIIGAYQSASEIKLYTMDGSCVESGFNHSTGHEDIQAKPWYDDVLALNGHKYITTPRTNTYLPAGGNNRSSQKFISLIRLFLDSADKPEGIVEVIQDCSKVFGLAEQLQQSNKEISVYVYNSEGRLMFPYNQPVDSEDYSLLARKNGVTDGQSQLVTTSSDRTFLLSTQNIPGYQWTVIVTQTEESLYLPLRIFRVSFLLIAGFSILFTLLVCFLLSRRITSPLKKLTAAAGKITINRILDAEKVNLTSADSSIKELSILCEAIRSMYEKLRSTSKEVLLSHNEETRAKLQATQSLINPHFLYNSLTSISIMSEEEMNDDIIRMCQALCGYFRYISSSKEMVVPLEEEIRYTNRYLECMQLRFTDELDYQIHLQEDTKGIYIPKLITQPIVENAFKYAFTGKPPWHLSISSMTRDGHWMIRIEDNGGNLSDARKDELLSLYENLDFNKEVKSLKIGGMGLKNVYLRLRLVYGENSIFKIDNSTAGRTVFILGGNVLYSKEEYYENLDL